MVSHKHTHLSFLSLSVASLSVSSSSPLCCPDRKPSLTSRRLCFCLDLRIEFFRGPRHQIWNRNCCLISLEAGRGMDGGKLPSSITPLCSLFSSERITSFCPPTPPRPPHTHTHTHKQTYPSTSVLLQVRYDTNIQKQMSNLCTSTCTWIGDETNP